MEWLNYHHLQYFWTVAKEGSVTRAAEVLNLTQPTLSAQIRSLEGTLGGRLFARAGRGLVMTDLGRLTYGYADEIFGLGRELLGAAQGRSGREPRRFAVGVSDALSKSMVYQLLRPALALAEPVRLVCIEEGFDAHIRMLLRHELDLVLSDAPLGAHAGPRAYNHLLGEAEVKFFGTPELIARFPGGLPATLQGAPIVVPPADVAVRRALDHWFTREDIRPQVVAEVADRALLLMFGAEGSGFVPLPAILTQSLAARFGLFPVGTIPGLKERIYAISVERRLKHAAVLAIQEAAVREVFV
jgi:LysR family transcriptional activator of nhaA